LPLPDGYYQAVEKLGSAAQPAAEPQLHRRNV